MLVSPFYPEAGFNAGNAMGRNKYIYALADRALVIDSTLGSGGTWQGAVEVLKERWVPLYIRTPGNGPGNEALVKKGGIAFTYKPGDGEGLLEFFQRTAPSINGTAEPAPAQRSLLSMAKTVDGDEATSVAALGAEVVPMVEASDLPAEAQVEIEESVEVATSERKNTPVADPSELAGAVPEAINGTIDVVTSETEATPAADASEPPDAALEAIREATPAHHSYATVAGSNSDALPNAPTTRDIYDCFLLQLALAVSSGPLTEEEVSGQLGLERMQTKVWLKQAVESGCIEKLTKPVRYGQLLQAALPI